MLYVGSFNKVGKGGKYGGYVNLFVDEVTGNIFEDLDLSTNYAFEDKIDVLNAKFLIASKPCNMFRSASKGLKIASGVVVGRSVTEYSALFEYDIYVVWYESDIFRSVDIGFGICLLFNKRFSEINNHEGSIEVYGMRFSGNYTGLNLGNLGLIPYSCFTYHNILNYLLKYLKFSVVFCGERYILDDFEDCR